MKKAASALRRLHDGITTMAAYLAAAGLVLIVVSYVYEVVTRYFFGAPTSWVSDFVSYTLCASIFLALPKVTRDKSHVAVTIVVDYAPPAVAGLVHTLISLTGFVCLGFAAWVSFQENLRQYSRNIETLAIMPVPQWWISGFITLGLAVSSIYFLRYASPRHRATASWQIEKAG